jgi:hypothetical protein
MRKVSTAVLERCLGVADHRVVHVVGLGLRDEALSLLAPDGGQRAASARRRLGP